MGLFNKLFGKKQSKEIPASPQVEKKVIAHPGESFIATGEHSGYKVIRSLTDNQREQFAKSTLPIRTGQLYMHYYTDNLVYTDREDPEWQNKVLFFWNAEEPFTKKSLPPAFKTYKEKYFLFTDDTSRITIKAGRAIPWFGMPGLGAKHYCEIDGQNLSIPELHHLGLVEYVESVELTNDNLDILLDKDHYMLLVDERLTRFENGIIYLDNKPAPVDVAYSIGGIHIIRKTGL